MSNANTIFLMPGDIHFSNEELYVMTILGSCVSIIFYDKKSKYSGVSHCLLPKKNLIVNDRSDNIFRYVDTTIEFLVNKFDELGANRKDLEIKLFGGASIHPKVQDSKINVGINNVEMAKEVLSNYNLRIKKQDTGGLISRKIIVSTSNGDVFLKRI